MRALLIPRSARESNTLSLETASIKASCGISFTPGPQENRTAEAIWSSDRPIDLSTWLGEVAGRRAGGAVGDRDLRSQGQHERLAVHPREADVEDMGLHPRQISVDPMFDGLQALRNFRFSLAA